MSEARARDRAPGARGGRSAWPALRRERHHRHARHAYALRLADSCGPSAVRRCGMRGVGARGRRRDARQDRHHRIRPAPSRTDGEPAQPLHTPPADRRADPPPRSPTSWCRSHSARRPAAPSSAPRRIAACRLQTLVQHDQPDRGQAARRKLRHRRPLRPLRRRLRAGRRRASRRRARHATPRGRACPRAWASGGHPPGATPSPRASGRWRRRRSSSRATA